MTWKIYLLGTLTAVILLAAVPKAIDLAPKLLDRYRPNVLILSLCSFRQQLLSFYGAEDNKTMPNLEQFMANSSFRFRNAVNGLGWTAIFGYTNLAMDPEFVEGAGYSMHGHRGTSRQLMRIPRRRAAEAGEVVNDNDYEKNVQASMANLKEIITSKKHGPFYLIAHNKYMHYPLIDRFNADSEWDQFLSPDEKKRIKDYLARPEKYYRKLPFLLLLANNPRHALVHPKIKALNRAHSDLYARELTGLVTNRELLRDWMGSPGYADDLVMLKKIYRANAAYLDKLIAPVLDLYGDQELKENTIIFFAGDHGELHMERDELTHGLSFWDESLRVPLAVHFPQSPERSENIERQTNFNTLAKTIRQIISGENTADEFKSNLDRYGDDLVIGRDCANTLRGLRYDNKIKYFVRLADGERFLFNLEKDPRELNNIALKKPGLTAKYEVMYWKNFDRFSGNDAYGCTLGENNEDPTEEEI